MWYERGWQWIREHLTVTVPGVVMIFAATFIVMLAVDAGEVGAAWVQAIGSILALVVAIAVPLRMRMADDRNRDLAQGMRLYTAIWEAHKAVQQLVRQEEALQEVLIQEEIARRILSSHQPSRERGCRLRQRDVDFFSRIMQRASSNLDDDLCAQRLLIASRFRFDLSVLISFMQVRVDVPADGTLLVSLIGARDSFDRELQKLVEVNPALRSVMVR